MLRKVRHQNVIKLYGYNLNARYPAAGKDANEYTHGESTAYPVQKYIDAILLVLEYAPVGDLFDILYYTSALKEVVARTYFKQSIDGLEACHNANVVHCVLKPQNLLLDSKYNLSPISHYPSISCPKTEAQHMRRADFRLRKC